ncbi:MAG TPA: hypothetical protein GXX40_00690 [Firmicutes bacterium]|nr:hypothetical protein [Bacillota bacterium]
MRKLAKAIVVSALLAVGSATAIMNFHSDVNMREVQCEVFKMITGVRTSQPLLLQIPYSIGIAIGVLVFFNHLRMGGRRDEPSPLEVEMYLYDRNVEACMKQKGSKKDGNSG